MKAIGVIWRYFAPRYPHPQIVSGHIAGMILWAGLVVIFK